MKSFTIELPNKKQDNNGFYKNYLIKRLLSSYPELTIDGIDTEETPYSYQYIGPSGRIGFGSDYYTRCDVAKHKNCKYCPFNKPENYNIATQFELAMKKLDDYAKLKRGYKPLYDFLLPDGTPVREYSNFIQVGYNMIPKKGYHNYFNGLSNEEKINITNIIIVINNTIEVNAELNL